MNAVPVPEGMTLIQGAEIHPDNPFGGPGYHLLAYNMTDDVDAQRMPPQHVIDAVREQGGSVWLAHPHWSGINVRRDVMPLTGLAGIEVFNTICQRMGRGEAGIIWDDWMDHAGHPLPAIANDDCHGNPAHGDDLFQGWSMVRAADRSPQAIVAALERGDRTARHGPEIRSLRVTRSGSRSRPIGSPGLLADAGHRGLQPDRRRLPAWSDRSGEPLRARRAGVAGGRLGARR